MDKNKKEVKRYSKIVMIIILFSSIFGVTSSHSVSTNANAVTLTPEAQKCSEEPKKQGKQAIERFKMSWMYSEKKQACFYTFAEEQSTGIEMKSGIRKKDASGNVSEFYIYEKETSNAALTILSMIELPSGEIVIGGSRWLMSTDVEHGGFYAIIGADGKVKYKNKTDGQSVEKVNTDNQKIVLAGSQYHKLIENDSLKGSYVTPYIVTTDMNGNELEKKEFENLRGYWFADAKLYKSKYIRTSLGEYKSQSNGTEGPVKWLNLETLSEVTETEVNLDDQTTYTENGSIKYDITGITTYNESGKKLKNIPYTASVSRVIPLPQQDDNTFIVAEIGTSIVLKSVSADGENGKESVDTHIGVETTDKVDFRQVGDDFYLYIIGSKGDENLYPLEISNLKIEKPKSKEKKVEQKSNQAVKKKDAGSENRMIFFIAIGAGVVITLVFVLTTILIIKKRRGKSTTKKAKMKTNKKVANQFQPQKSEALPQQHLQYVEPNQPVYEETLESMTTEQVYQPQYVDPAVEWNEQPQFDTYENVMEEQPQYVDPAVEWNEQPQFDTYENVMEEQPQYVDPAVEWNEQPQFDTYENVMEEQPQYVDPTVEWNEQPQFDAYGNIINEQPEYIDYGNEMENQEK